MAARANMSTDGLCELEVSSASDIESGRCGGSLFPSLYRGERLASLSDVILCQRVSRVRTSRAHVEQTAEEQLNVLQSNPFLQELRRRQGFQKRQLRVSRRASTQHCPEYATCASVSEHRCMYWWCGDSFADRANFVEHIKMHEDGSETSDDGQCRLGVVHWSLAKMSQHLRYGALIRKDADPSSSSESECGASDVYSSISASVYDRHHSSRQRVGRQRWGSLALSC